MLSASGPIQKVGALCLAHSKYVIVNKYMGQCKRKLGFCNFFQVFKFNSFWIQDSALYKTVLTHPKLDSVSESYKALNF